MSARVRVGVTAAASPDLPHLPRPWVKEEETPQISGQGQIKRGPDQAPKIVLMAKAVFLFMSFSTLIIFLIGVPIGTQPQDGM